MTDLAAQTRIQLLADRIVEGATDPTTGELEAFDARVMVTIAEHAATHDEGVEDTLGKMAIEISRLARVDPFGDADRARAGDVVRGLKAKIAELDRKVDEYRTLWSQADDRARAYQRELDRRDRPAERDGQEEFDRMLGIGADAEDKAPPAVAGYMHTYQPAIPRPCAAGEVLPPEQRASWARGKVPGIDK